MGAIKRLVYGALLVGAGYCIAQEGCAERAYERAKPYAEQLRDEALELKERLVNKASQLEQKLEEKPASKP